MRSRSVVGRVWWCCVAVALLGGVLSLVGVSSVSASGWQTQSNGVRVLKRSFVDYDNFRLVCSGTQADASELRCEAQVDRVWNVQVQAKNPNRNSSNTGRCDSGSRVNLGHLLEEQNFYFTGLTIELAIGGQCVMQGSTWIGSRKVTHGSQPLKAQSGTNYADGFSTRFDLGLIIRNPDLNANEDDYKFIDGVAVLDKGSEIYVGEVCFGITKTHSAGIQFTRSFFSNLGIPETAYLEWCVSNQNDRSVAQADAITDVAAWARHAKAIQLQRSSNEDTTVGGYSVPASLIGDVRSYAAETSNGDAHVDRWKRVLVAFGETVPGFSGTAMSAAEATQHAQTFWSVRWDPVAAALTALETAQAQQAQVESQSETDTQQQTPSYTVPASLIADVQGYATETGNGDAHVDRWKRVLVAFGEAVPGFSGTAMSAAEATQHAQTFWSVRWDPVVAALTALEAQPAPETSGDETSETSDTSENNPPPADPPPVDPVPVDPPVVDPVVSVTAGADITEGSDAVFTLTASPAPTAPLDVTVEVTASGDYGATAGTRTVTVPTTGTATLSVATTDDGTDEADGSVTATITNGTGYDPDTSAATATVNVTDNDDPPPPPPPPAVPASLSAFSVTDGTHTEGSGNYYFFFVSLDKPVNKPTRVSYTVEATGNGPGHATAGDDFVATSRTIFFRPGLTRNAGLVVVKDDNLKEPNETLQIVLSNPQGATIDGGTATITIKDND